MRHWNTKLEEENTGFFSLKTHSKPTWNVEIYALFTSSPYAERGKREISFVRRKRLVFSILFYIFFYSTHKYRANNDAVQRSISFLRDLCRLQRSQPTITEVESSSYM